MNLIDLLKRKDRALAAPAEGLEIGVLACDGVKMSGVHWPVGARLELRGFLAFDELRGWPRELGWSVTCKAPLLRKCGAAGLRAWIAGLLPEPIPVAATDAEAGRWRTVRFDWPLALLEPADPSLRLEVHGEAGASLFLGVCEAVDLRKPILALARGQGIEIGPGMSPQVLPGPAVDVRYLERTTLTQWQDLYSKGGATPRPDLERLWQRYIVGDAQRLDGIADASQDFIFSSHVFEHLANPLGTLAAWHARLRPGGHVLGVVPDAHSCFDLRQPLSTAAEWHEEWSAGIWDCQQRHYEKWCRYTAPNLTPERLRAASYSIHAHYYTPATFATLLQHAVERLGYRSFHIHSLRNNKDFTWALRK
jgi:SAM-dependent methyltransferase